MELIGKLLVNTPVERGAESFTDRFAGRRFERRSGAAVLELNTLVAGMGCHRQHCGDTNQPAGSGAHKHPLSLLTACARPEPGEGESLVAISTESGRVNRTSVGRLPAPF